MRKEGHFAKEQGVEFDSYDLKNCKSFNCALIQIEWTIFLCGEKR